MKEIESQNELLIEVTYRDILKIVRRAYEAEVNHLHWHGFPQDLSQVAIQLKVPKPPKQGEKRA